MEKKSRISHALFHDPGAGGRAFELLRPPTKTVTTSFEDDNNDHGLLSLSISVCLLLLNFLFISIGKH